MSHLPKQTPSRPRAATDFSGLGIAVFCGGKIASCNGHFLKVAGLSGKKNPLSDDFLNWVYFRDRQSVSRSLEKLSAGKEESLQIDLRSAGGGRFRHYRANLQAVNCGDLPAVHLVLEEICDRKKPAGGEGIDELKLYHEERLTALGIMAAGIAHELNQPLNTIRVVTDGFLFGRAEGWPLDQDELLEGLEMISRQVIRMDKVIRNIRNFSRDERGQSAESVSVNEAVENVFSMIGRQIEAHGIRVEKDLDPDAPTIRATINEFEQVVMNLIVNARQALDDSSRTVKILRVATGRRDGQVFVEVSDNATGIPEALVERIFDPFFTTKAAGKGTGLGLSISQSIVGTFGGRIDVCNNEGGGATFVIRIPAGGEKDREHSPDR